jgi:hypothetical protein
MARRPHRGTERNPASHHQGEVAAAAEVVRRVTTLADLDHRLSRLTWSEIGLADEGPTQVDAGRRRNRFAALRPEVAAGRTTLSRRTRVRALTCLLHEVGGLRAELAAKGRLTVPQLTRVRRVFGGHPGPLRDYFVGVAGPSGQASSTMSDALAIEETLLVGILKVVRRVPDPVPPLKLGRIRWLSIRQLLRLSAAARHELREHMLVLGLAVHFCETNPPRS